MRRARARPAKSRRRWPLEDVGDGLGGQVRPPFPGDAQFDHLCQWPVDLCTP